MKIAIIGDSETVAGFALGGVSLRYVVSEILEAEEALKEVMQDEEIAVLLMTSEYVKNLESEIEKWNEINPVYPLIVEVRPRGSKGKGEDRIKDLIRRAVGITIE